VSIYIGDAFTYFKYIGDISCHVSSAQFCSLSCGTKQDIHAWPRRRPLSEPPLFDRSWFLKIVSTTQPLRCLILAFWSHRLISLRRRHLAIIGWLISLASSRLHNDSSASWYCRLINLEMYLDKKVRGAVTRRAASKNL